MLIELLYVPGCPHHELALRRIADTLHSVAVEEAIREIAVSNETMAQALAFPGSPTIRIDGIDVEAAKNPFVGLACRLYPNGDGAPSNEMLKRAILIAKRARSAL